MVSHKLESEILCVLFLTSCEQKCPGTDKGDWTAATDTGGPEGPRNTLYLSLFYQVSLCHTCSAFTLFYMSEINDIRLHL